MGIEISELEPYSERKPAVHVGRAVKLTPDIDRTAFSEFVAGLKTMSADFDAVVANFDWCAGQIAGDPNANTQIRGMMEFASQLHQFGLETAMQAAIQSSGLKTEIAIPEKDQLTEEGVIRTTGESKKKSGIIVGFANARHIKNEPVFEGIAIMENSRGQEAFVAVWIKLDGTTILNPAAHVGQYPDPHKERLMQDLYPKSK